MTVKRGREICGYYLPVLGDSKRPDLDVQARMKLQKPSSKHIRKHAFVGVAVRAGPDTHYELRVFPKGKQFLLKRSPHSADVSESGKEHAINPLDHFNRLELRAFGHKLKAYVNGEKVAVAKDPSPDDVKGRRVEILVGDLHKTDNNLSVRVDSAQAGVPKP